MRRADCLEAIYDELAGCAVVTIMGAVAVELYSLGHRPNFFYLEHAMGLASSMGLGIALSQPERKVVVLDGDGSVLMNLGGLTTLARYAPGNLTHIVFDNQSLLSVGGFPTATATGSDLAGIAHAAGIANAEDRHRPGGVPDGRDRGHRRRRADLPGRQGRAGRPQELPHGPAHAREPLRVPARPATPRRALVTDAVQNLVAALAAGQVEVVDLTQPLSEETPVLRLPEPFANTPRFRLRELSHYDERGPAWYWNAFEGGEHTGTHFDAPIHWVSGQELDDVSQVPPSRLIGPAVVIDHADRAAADPDHLLRIEDVEAFEATHGPLPDGAWLLYRTGWDARAQDEAAFLNADDTGPHTPGIDVACARWLASERPILGIGVETVGTDAGAAHGFDPPFPCHAFLLGAGRYGLTQLANVGRLPPTGALLIAAPLKIVGGSGSPTRVLALVPR